ncbi:hypothetical protein NDU88_007273 [Pleurodeles waltl]|uniref:Uncharacterized protein n=1 Tax=Pleurodeles waltl TaxID=8319 RepID=A0AAV7N2Z6_PLEWA|nr:hypothetical protein NDU88_007273 [Pleurodeles waltl]
MRLPLLSPHPRAYDNPSCPKTIKNAAESVVTPRLPQNRNQDPETTVLSTYMNGRTLRTIVARKAKENGGCRVLHGSAEKREEIEERTSVARTADRPAHFRNTGLMAATTRGRTCGGSGEQ